MADEPIPQSDDDARAAKRAKTKEYHRLWREKNADHVRAKGREAGRRWNANNREKKRASSNAWKKANAERVKAYRADYYIAHRTEELETARNWQKTNAVAWAITKKAWETNNYQQRRVRFAQYKKLNSEKLKQYQRAYKKANPERCRFLQNKRRAIQMGSVQHVTHEDVLTIFKAQRGRCAYCKKPMGTKYQIDHIKALSKGGSNDRRNIQLTCKPCNSSKHASDAIIFAQRIGLLL